MLRRIFDSKNSSGWLIGAAFIMMIGIFATFIMPMIISLSRFRLDSKIGFSPAQSSYGYTFIAFLLLAFGLYLVYKFMEKKWRFTGGVAGVALFGCFIYFAFNAYTYIDEDYIEFGKGYTSYQYTWEEINELYYNSDGTNDWYEIVTNDGKRYDIVFGGLLNTGAKNHVRRVLEEYGIKMIDIS